jgi:hypothetical protein
MFINHLLITGNRNRFSDKNSRLKDPLCYKTLIKRKGAGAGRTCGAAGMPTVAL